jgi:hypothetical protein
MYGHEKQLLLKLKDKPFAILGINSDQTREKAKAVVAEKQHVTRTWWDGGSTRGPIAKAWNVKGWPTIYILDHKGVIRFKGARGEAMDKAVEQLLHELDAETTEPEKKDADSSGRRYLRRLKNSRSAAHQLRHRSASGP